MINFMKYRWIYFGISGALLVVSLLSLSIWKLRPSIDFTGGALIELKIPGKTENIPVDEFENKVREVADIHISSVQFSPSTQSYIIRLNSINESKKNEILTKVSDSFGQPEELRFETVGPTLGRELLIKTGVAVLIASILITIYIGYQFKDKKYGLAAVLAMFHDTIILLGAFSILGFFKGVEVDTLFVTAVLTTLSFSVHDTIVVFDRIRESTRGRNNLSMSELINRAITETLPRSLNNSMTIIFMLTALALLGGATIRWFVVALLIGTIAGTYSSPFIASPILMSLMNWKKKK